MPERRILCVSFDKMVSENRCATLKEAGYDVTATTSIKEAVEWLSQKKFDAVIVGHRFPAEEKYVLAVEATEKSKTPILSVCGATRDSEIPATKPSIRIRGKCRSSVRVVPRSHQSSAAGGSLRPHAR